MESVGVKGRMHWTGQSGIMVFNTIPATSDGGKSSRRRILHLLFNQRLQLKTCGCHDIGELFYSPLLEPWPDDVKR